MCPPKSNVNILRWPCLYLVTFEVGLRCPTFVWFRINSFLFERYNIYHYDIEQNNIEQSDILPNDTLYFEIQCVYTHTQTHCIDQQDSS
jgi:hypothetical protein